MAYARSRKDNTLRKGSIPWEPFIFLLLILVLSGAGAYMFLDQRSIGDGTEKTYDEGPPSSDGTPAYLRIPIQDVEGPKFNLSVYKGRIVLLDMFATWCGPCMSQLSELQKVRDLYPESDVAIITVDVDESESASDVKELKDERGLTWRFAMSNPRFSSVFKASSIPTLYYLDQDGRIADKAVGAESFSEVRERIERIKER